MQVLRAAAVDFDHFFQVVIQADYVDADRFAAPRGPDYQPPLPISRQRTSTMRPTCPWPPTSSRQKYTPLAEGRPASSSPSHTTEWLPDVSGPCTSRRTSCPVVP